MSDVQTPEGRPAGAGDRADAAFFAGHPVAFLRGQSDRWLESRGRLTEPVYLAPYGTCYEPVSWGDALALIAGRLRALPDPDRALFYAGGRASNEAAFALQLLARRFGTSNLPGCPVRGHGSGPGSRTTGAREKAPGDFLDRLRDEFGFEPPRGPGLDVAGAIRAMRGGRASVFIGVGGNFAAAAPDGDAAAAGLSECALTVHVSTRLNRSQVITGHEALILPCLEPTERDVTAAGEQYVTAGDPAGAVHAPAGRVAPASGRLRSEVAIVTGIGAALFGEDIGWAAMGADYSLIRRHIAAVGNPPAITRRDRACVAEQAQVTVG